MGKNISGDTKTFKFHVHGMHCASCEILTERELKEVPYVTNVKASLSERKIVITGYFGEMDELEAAQLLSKHIEKHGYRLSLEMEKSSKWKDFKLALPIALLFVALFVLLQKAGIVNMVNATELSYGTAFVVGIVASLSTCMAVVGGLVLSMSATFAKDGDKFRPQFLFHIGRLVSFFLLGGLIGAIGSAFTLNTGATFVLGMVIGLAMLVMGINLLDVFHRAKKFQISMPKFISSRVIDISKMNHRLTPALVGIATFFLPCGFTQSMQIYTLSTGSFTEGGLTMFAFALGTLPALALLSFGSLAIKGKQSSVFFKTAGIIVILFALLNILNSFVIIGIIPPFLNI